MKKNKSALEMGMHYINMQKMVPASSMLREAKHQYIDMARGGDGGSLGYVPEDYTGPAPGAMGATCREHNYPNHPDSFFQEVCAIMGWVW